MAANALFFYEPVPAANVVATHQYADPVAPTVGTNTDFAATADPATLDVGPAGLWGLTHPAQAATDPVVDIPGVGFGTATLAVNPITDAGDIDCDTVKTDFCTRLGHSKTYKFVPTQDGNPIDLTGKSLTFVIEGDDKIDTIVGAASQHPDGTIIDGVDVSYQVYFTDTQAYRNIGTYNWAVRVSTTGSDGAVVGDGTIGIEYAPIKDDGSVATNGTLLFVTQDSEGTVVGGAMVRLTTDQTGFNVVESKVSEADGTLEFTGLATGVYWPHATLSGYRFADPVSYGVTG